MQESGRARREGRGYIDSLHERQVYYSDVYKRTCMNKIRIVPDSVGIDSNSRGEIKRNPNGKRGNV